MNRDNDNDEQEMGRLRQVILSSEALDADPKQAGSTICTVNKTTSEVDNDARFGMLSPELLDGYAASDDIVLVGAKKKKVAAKKTARTLLTPQEIKQATAASKKAARKLQQLQDKAAQKQRRAQCYDSLKDTAISYESSQLLSRAADLGKPVTKRQQLQQLLRKEQAGLTLSATEQTILYQPATQIMAVTNDPGRQDDRKKTKIMNNNNTTALEWENEDDFMVVGT